MVIDENILASKEAAKKWTTLFLRALPDCDDVEESVVVANLAYEELPANVELSVKQPEIITRNLCPKCEEKPLPAKKVDAQFAHDIYNRKAQGILNRSVAVAKRISASAKRDLEKALKTDDRVEISRALDRFIIKYRIQLADLLTTTQLAALLEGAREVAKSIPVVPLFPGASQVPATLEPKRAMELLDELRQLPVADLEQRIYLMPADQQAFARQGLLAQQLGGMEPPANYIPLAPMSGEPERVHYPIIDEAAKQLAEKNVMTRSQFDTLDATARQKAFTVAHVESLDTLAKIQDVLAETIEQGVDLQTFREKVIEAVGEGTFMSPWHLETVLRTNVQTAFSDGQMSVLQHPFVRSGFPYAAYEAIHDDRVRHNHLALMTCGIQGTNIYRIDDPVFLTFRPPWDFCDRCSWIPMTVRFAASKGIQEAKDWLATGVEPSDRAFVPMPPFRPPVGFQRSLSGMPLSIRLSLESLGDYGASFAVKEKGHWITIGGSKGSDGERHGGSPVYVENGRITKGSPKLTGKKLGNLKGDDDQSTHRQLLGREKNYQRAVWAKKARKEGIDPKGLHWLADDMKKHHDANVDDVTSMLQSARKTAEKLGTSVSHLKAEFNKGDHTTISDFDILARELAGEYPHLLGAHGYSHHEGYDADAEEASEKLFAFLKEGNPEKMSEEQAYTEAFDYLLTQKSEEKPAPKKKRKKEVDEDVPFSLFNEKEHPRNDHGEFVKKLGEIPHGELKHVGGLPVRRKEENDYRIDTDDGHVSGDADKIATHILDDHAKRKLHGKKREVALRRGGKESSMPDEIKNNLPSEGEWLTVLKAAWKRNVHNSEWDGDPGLCYHGSCLLQDYLAKKGIKTKLVDGQFGPGDGHVWLETSDGTIIDNSKSQYDHTVKPGEIVVYSKDNPAQKRYHAELRGRIANEDDPSDAKRMMDFSDTDSIFSQKHEKDAKDFAALPAGSKVVSLDANTYGRVGEIVKDDGVSRVKLEGTPGFASDYVEPLDEKLSWREKPKEKEKPSESDALFDDDESGKKKKRSAKPKHKKSEIHGESLEADTAEFFRSKGEQGRLFSLGVQMGISAMFAQVHAPAGEPTVINGKTYQPGEFIPGDVLRSAPEPERKALLNTTHIRASDEGEILSHQEEGSYDASVVRDYKTSAAKTKFAGLDKEFGERAASYLSRHIQSEAEKFNSGVSELVDDGDWEDDGIRKVNTLRDAFAERIYDHADTYKRAIANHFKKRWQGRFSDERQKQLEDKLDELASGLEEQAYAIAGEIEENIASDTMDQETWDAITNLEQETQDLTNYMSDAVNEIEDEMNAIVDAENEAEEKRQQEFADTYFEDVQADVESELPEDADDDEIRRVWEEAIRGYNAKMKKSEQYRISLTDDGDLEVVLEDDLPEEFRPKKEAKLSVTSASGVQQFLGILRGDQ